jgi:hypothetical protein
MLTSDVEMENEAVSAMRILSMKAVGTRVLWIKEFIVKLTLT